MILERGQKYFSIFLGIEKGNILGAWSCFALFNSRRNIVYAGSPFSIGVVSPMSQVDQHPSLSALFDQCLRSTNTLLYRRCSTDVSGRPTPFSLGVISLSDFISYHSISLLYSSWASFRILEPMLPRSLVPSKQNLQRVFFGNQCLIRHVDERPYGNLWMSYKTCSWTALCEPMNVL